MKTGLKSGIIQSTIILAFLAIWQLIPLLGIVDSLFLASPSQLLVGDWLAQVPSWATYFRITVIEILVSYGLSVTVGIFLGFLLGRNDYFYRVFQPFVVWGYSIPKIAFFPVFVRFFGLGVNCIIAYGTITGVFVILVNTIAGVREMDQDLLRVSNSLGLNGFQRYSKVIFPYITPTIFSGMRQGVIHVVLGVLIAEIALQTIGVGDLVDVFSYTFKTVELYAVVSIVALVMIALNVALLRIEDRLGFWRERE